MNSKKIRLVAIVLTSVIIITGLIVFFLSFSLNSQYKYTDLGIVFAGDKALLWTHVITNVLIGIAYMFIPITLLRLVKKTGHKIPFTWTFFAFGGFIIACGLTHFMASLTTWAPAWWIAQIFNWITVVVSLGTAIAIFPVVPKVAEIVDSAAVSAKRKHELEETNKKLNAEIKNVKSARRDVLEMEFLDKKKELFLSQISHEIKTPLVPIMGYTEMIKSGEFGDVTKKQKEKLSIIYRNAEELQDLINNLLTVSRIDLKKLKLNIEKVNISALAHQVKTDFSILEKRFNAVITINGPQKLMVTCDKTRMKEVIQNLVKNAIQYGKKVKKNNIIVKIKDQKDTVMIEVSDSGTGISDQNIKKLFNQFERTKESIRSGNTGSGLGLFISKKLVEAHGGTIALKSKVGVGSTFTVIIPKIAKKQKE